MSNITKTLRFFKRNGFKKTYYAVMERLFYKDVSFCAHKYSDYPFMGKLNEDIKFSILVPVYETKEKYLRELIDSVLAQVYPNFELILADASRSKGPEGVIKAYEDTRIKYVKISENKGISENTNVAIEAAIGDYCGLLDHDDLLTPDALYEMAVGITKALDAGVTPKMLYSDEDKCNEDATAFFEPHYKEKLNLDLILSNNYICHFAVIKTDLIKQLKFRKEYDGSQDYDLFLRVILNSENNEIIHINRLLYHWRCHEESTSSNPESKEYAYSAGKKAIEDFVKNRFNIDAVVSKNQHKGYYNVDWGEDIFMHRPDVGATGTFYIKKNKITSGIINKDGSELMHNMNKHYSGYMHRAHLYSDVYALDIRTIKINPMYPELVSFYVDLMDEFNEYIKDKKSEKEITEAAKIFGLKLGDELCNKKLLLLFVPMG